jgi:hypothetical protein
MQLNANQEIEKTRLEKRREIQICSIPSQPNNIEMQQEKS